MKKWVVATLCLLAAGGASLTSCSSSHDGQSASSDSSGGSDATDQGGRGCAANDPGTKAVEKCLSPSVAFVATDEATGSGVLLDNGFLLTNAHVVEPYSTVIVVFPDGDEQDDVPVKGVDFQADMALVGPIKGDHPKVKLSDPADLEKGDKLELVGYPGGASNDEQPDVTIAEGVLSRTRTSKRFGLDFLQTDATIDGGQSGGALADETGRVVGISGYDLGGFALALSGPSAQKSVDRIAAGQGDPYGELRDMPKQKTGSITVDSLYQSAVLVSPAGPARTLHLELSGGDQALVGAFDVDGTPVFVEDRLDAFFKSRPDAFGDFGFDSSTVKPRTAPGVYDIPLEEGFSTLVMVATASPTPIPMTFTASEPLGIAPPPADPVPVKVGDSKDGVVGLFETGDDYTIDLQAGQSIDILASSAVGDAGYTVRLADNTGLMTEVDDSNEGLFGVDAHDTFKAPAAGRYVITVIAQEPFSVAYRLEINGGDGGSPQSDDSDHSDGSDAGGGGSSDSTDGSALGA